MLRVTIRGLLAHKVRLVATAVAVLLGVAFMTGTQVLTTSVGASFDKVFADVYAPIVEAVHSVVEGEMTAADMLTALISKETKHERD